MDLLLRYQTTHRRFARSTIEKVASSSANDDKDIIGLERRIEEYRLYGSQNLDEEEDKRVSEIERCRREQEARSVRWPHLAHFR